MSAFLANLSVGIGVTLAGVSILLMVLGLLAYQRLKHGRMLWLAVAFGLFAALGIINAVQAYQTRSNPALPAGPILGLAIVFALYLAVLKR
jgi:drug/metabolite transporter (DMT)-like permease